MDDIANIKKKCQLKILQLYMQAKAGHIASSLSCLDILIALYFKQMRKQDEFILSKGHAALALYVVLEEAGVISDEELETFYTEGTNLGAHPPCNRKVNGILFGTGSLGHGLSLSSGIALASRYSEKKNKVYCLLSDGDCDEGSTWEAALFAGHHRLNNLITIIDNNGLQGLGRSKDVLDLDPLKEKWESFNFDVYLADKGNDLKAILAAFDSFDFQNPKPKCLILNTTKGSGISFMENRMEWHYLPMSDDDYKKALIEINKS